MRISFNKLTSRGYKKSETFCFVVVFVMSCDSKRNQNENEKW